MRTNEKKTFEMHSNYYEQTMKCKLFMYFITHDLRYYNECSDAGGIWCFGTLGMHGNCGQFSKIRIVATDDRLKIANFENHFYDQPYAELWKNNYEIRCGKSGKTFLNVHAQSTRNSRFFWSNELFWYYHQMFLWICYIFNSAMKWFPFRSNRPKIERKREIVEILFVYCRSGKLVEKVDIHGCECMLVNGEC